MGMFDTYTPKPALVCPLCGGALSDWQGKDGPNCLLEFAQGDEVPEGDDYGWWREPPAPDRLEIYTTCQSGHWIDAHARLEGRRWVETLITGSRELPPREEWREPHAPPE